MRKLLLLTGFLLIAQFSIAQLKFVARFEVPSEIDDPLFEMSYLDLNKIISFRSMPEKGFTNKRKLQYFISDQNLEPESELIEMPVKDGFDMVGFDLDEGYLYLLFSKGFTPTSTRYILQIDLETNEGVEFSVDNVLGIVLREFLVQNKKVIFMGNADTRPVVQIYDLVTKGVYTVHGIYANDTQLMQIRKLPEMKSLQVVLNRKGKYRNRDLYVNTYDMNGNLMQEVKVDQFGEPGQEILNGILISKDTYQETLIGSYGLERRDAYQGMFIMDINEFGEHSFKLYTLEDFPNFYNYLGERQKKKRDAKILSELEKDKLPAIENTYTIRDVRLVADAYYVFFDQYSAVNARADYQQGLYGPSSGYRFDRWNRMQGFPSLNDPVMNRYPFIHSDRHATEYRYYSAHFAKVAKTGQVLWDNSSSYNELITTYPMAFSEIAVVEDELYHAYIEDLTIKLSYFNKGEKIFENHEFDLALVDENERIVDTNAESLRIIHWYDRYYLVTGTQRVKYQDDTGGVATREAYFLTKIVVDGDLYHPEGLSD